MPQVNGLERVKLTGELGGIQAKLAGPVNAIERVRLTKRIGEIVVLLGGDMPVASKEAGPRLQDLKAVPKEPTAWVSEKQLAKLTEAVAKFSKKAAKLGLPPMKLVVGEDKFVRWWSYDDGGSRPVWRTHPLDWFPPMGTIPMPKSSPDLEKLTFVTLVGEPPKLGGWSFMAKVEHEQGGNIIKNVSELAIPERYLSSASYCEHCNTKRGRSATYLVHNDKSEVKQIGGSCLKDFTGNGSAESMANLAAFRSEFLQIMNEPADYDEDSFGEGGGRSPYKELEPYLVRVAQLVRKGGYSKGDDGFMPTKDEALVAMDKPGEYPKVEPEDIALAKAAIEWAKAISDETVLTNTYMNNLRVIARGSAFKLSNRGYAASIIPTYRREVEKQIEREQEQPSEWQGAVGKREVFKGLKVTGITVSDGQYGRTYIHRFKDGSGNVFTWFAAGTSLDEGKTYDIKATVKKHDEFKGVKQTVLTRTAAEEVGGMDEKVTLWKRDADGSVKTESTLAEAGVSRAVHNHIEACIAELKRYWEVGEYAGEIHYTSALTSEYDQFEKAFRFSTVGLSGTLAAANKAIDKAGGSDFVGGGLDGLIVHEFAHAIDARIKQSKLYDEWKAEKAKLKAQLGSPSKYADKNDSEWFAEQFAKEYMTDTGAAYYAARDFMRRV